MTCLKKYFSFFYLLALCLLQSLPVMAWDQSSQENVLVFDADGEIAASYHSGDWTTFIRDDGLATYETWNIGQPPSQTGNGSDTIMLSEGQVAVPNLTSGASTPPSATMPEVSLYSFDPSFFISTSPGDTPALSVSQAPGEYNRTIAVVLQALALSGSPVVEIKNPNSGQWEAKTNNPFTIHLATSGTIEARAANNGLTSAPQTLTYTITQPGLVDSDDDGFPDIWEIANGFNPLEPANTLLGTSEGSIDSDGDGFTDFYEILRGTDPQKSEDFPVDTDKDGWSDWDETMLRQTNPNDINDAPTATSLYEVEAFLSGTVTGNNGQVADNYDYAVETLQQRELSLGTTTATGDFSSRIPVGNEAFLRAQKGNNIFKRYMHTTADPVPADLNFTEADCLGDLSTCHLDWQDAWIAHLQSHLLIQMNNFQITPLSILPISLLERQLEILNGMTPEEIVLEFETLYPDELYPNADPQPWLAFGSFGHQPSPSAVNQLQDILRKTSRTVDSLMEELDLLAMSSCHTLADTINTIYNLHLSKTSMISLEQRLSRLLQEETGSYLAGLSMLHLLADLENLDGDLCEILDPLGDFDQDGVSNGQEVPTIEFPSGFSNPLTLDTDHDGVSDRHDNCPDQANTDQHDWDGDQLGDICDPDDDNDDLSDIIEIAYGSNPFNSDTNNDDTTDQQAWEANSDPGIAVYATTYITPVNLASQTIEGLRETGADVVISINSGTACTTPTYPTPTSWQCLVSDMNSDGPYNITLQATDPSDITRVGYGSLTIIVDSTPPVVTILSPTDGVTLDDPSPLLSYTVSDGIVDVLVDGSTVFTESGQQLDMLDEGIHTLRVESTDMVGNTGFAEISFEVDANQPPLAEAGPDQLALPDKTVTLDGSNSVDSDSALLSYLWTQVDGPMVAINDATAMTSQFTSPLDTNASLLFALTVTDDFGESSQSTCLINISETGSVPLADAGEDQEVAPLDPVQLNGSGSSDSDSSLADFAWAQRFGQPVPLTDSGNTTASFIAPAEENGLAFELMVTDDAGLRSRDQLVVNVISAGTSPTADAGTDQVAAPGSTVELNGSLSSDADGFIESYRWLQLTGHPVSISDPLAEITTFTLPTAVQNGVIFTFMLQVVDDSGLIDQAQVTITISTLDSDMDGDYDGVDLAHLAASGALNGELDEMAALFGR